MKDLKQQIYESCEFSKAQHIQPFDLFYKLNKVIPNKDVFHTETNKQKLFFEVRSKYSIPDELINFTRLHSDEDKEGRIVRFLMVVAKDIFLTYLNPPHDTAFLQILFCKTSCTKVLASLKRDVYDAKKTKEDFQLNLITNDPFMGGMSLNPFNIPTLELDIAKYYNDDCISSHEIILKSLEKPKQNGLVLLHGKAGTGKTTYIRHLIGKISKKMIYIPADMAEKIGDPSFMSLLSGNPNSIVIVEDAENILMERSPHRSGIISNILNIADGLLADCLNIQMICTFNTNIAAIDRALLRKGRIIASYEFDCLTIDKTLQLIKDKNIDYVTEKGLTLAEIFNTHTKQDKNLKQPSLIGFRN